MNQTYQELPMQKFIAGNSETYLYEMMDESGEPADLSGATVWFALADYSTKTVVVSKPCEIIQEQEDVPYKVIVRLDSAETIRLHGEYIQQLTVTDFYGKQKLPAEGRIIIIRNADPIVNNHFWYQNIQTGSFHASPAEITLPVGAYYSAKLFYTDQATQKICMPVYAGLTFSTTNPLIAQSTNKPESSGIISAIGAGQCEIIVSVTAKPEVYTQISVTVEKPNTKWYEDIKNGTFQADPSSITLVRGSVRRAQLYYISTASGLRLSPPVSEISFQTNNQLIATVDNSGLIFAREKGICKMTARLLDNTDIFTEIQITVTG